MTDNRVICVPCSRKTGKIVRFRAEKNGIIVPYGDTGARHGDLWMCAECGTAIVRGFGDPAWQPKVKARMRLSDRNILKGIKDGEG